MVEAAETRATPTKPSANPVPGMVAALGLASGMVWLAACTGPGHGEPNPFAGEFVPQATDGEGPPSQAGAFFETAGIIACEFCNHGPPAAPKPPRGSLTIPRTTRTWLSHELFANRLQDWRLDGEAIRCVETRANFPLRTAMVLPAEVDAEQPVRFVVGLSAADGSPRAPYGDPSLDGDWDTDAANAPPVDDAAGPQATGAFRGLLLGAGGAHVDHRLSAMVHHRPATDGGLVVAVDENGSVAVFDNGVPASAGGTWSLGGRLAEGELPRLGAAVAREPASPGDPIDLFVEIGEPGWLGGTSTLSVRTRSRGVRARVLARLEVDVARERLDGLFGLVSQGAPAADAHWGFDSLCYEGFGLREQPQRGYGPILGWHFTTGAHGLVVNVQVAPLGPDDDTEVRLRVPNPEHPELWVDHASAPIDRESWTARIALPDWDTSRDQPVAVFTRTRGTRGKLMFMSYGHIPAEPSPDEPFVIASLNCQKIYTGGLQWNHDGLWFPHAETARDVAAHEPDLLFFAGDQIYEGDLDPVDARDEDTLILDYLYKYTRHLWSFGALTRRIPSVVIPDDHDVYHGNLWGAGGRAAKARDGLSAQDAGGYKHGPRFVNVVHATQTGNLPDPVDPTPVEQGISVYTTELRYGGVSFAVLADRQWKSSASDVVPDGRVVNGWFQNPDFDPRDADVPEAVLLGERQERFLHDWAADWSDGTWMKVALSQTPFVNVATIPEKAAGGGVLPSLPVPEPDAYPEGYKFAADTDSGGWPQSGRDRAVQLMREGFALHLAGDQHLGSLVEYGLDAHRDGGFAFTAPAVANTWPRRWWPPIHGGNPEPGAPHYTGDFTDGFGNLMTVWAVANPVQSEREPRNLFERMPGYGIVRLHPDTRAIDLECWPRDVPPNDADAWQYAGWPRRVHQLDNHGVPTGWLGEVNAPGVERPVVRVTDEWTGEVVYTVRSTGDDFRPPVYGDGPFIVEFGEPGTDAWWTVRGVQAGETLTPR